MSGGNDSYDPNNYQSGDNRAGNGRRYFFVGCIVASVVTPIVLGFICCGGLVAFGLNEFAKEVVASVEDDPTFQREIGEDATASINWGHLFSDDEEMDQFFFNVEGENGSGMVEVIDGSTTIEKATLHKDGRKWELNVKKIDPFGEIER